MVQIADGLLQASDKILPITAAGVMPRNQHIIDTWTRQRGKMQARQRPHTAACAVATNRVSYFFRSRKADPPVILVAAGSMNYEAARKRFFTLMSRLKKIATRWHGLKSRHRSGIPQMVPPHLGRKARTTLCTTRPDHAATANRGHPRPEAMTTFTYQNTWLIGAFHLNAPLQFVEL